MPRILIIDDDVFLLQCLDRFLANLAPVDAASTAQEARRMLARHSYDVMVVDLNVGRDNGIDIAIQLQHERPDAIGAVILHTGHNPLPAPPLGIPVAHVVVSKGDLIGLRRAVAARLPLKASSAWSIARSRERQP